MLNKTLTMVLLGGLAGALTGYLLMWGLPHPLGGGGRNGHRGPDDTGQPTPGREGAWTAAQHWNGWRKGQEVMGPDGPSIINDFDRRGGRVLLWPKAKDGNVWIPVGGLANGSGLPADG